MSPASFSYADRMSASRSAGNGCSITAVRISLPTRASSSTSSVSRSFSLALIRSPNPVWEMNRRKASAVVAKPSGTFTPAALRLATISPREEFLPPTCSRSASPSSENQRTLVGVGGGIGSRGGHTEVLSNGLAGIGGRQGQVDAEGGRRVCRITVDISSTDLAEELIDGILWIR